MIDTPEEATLGETLFRAADRYGERSLVAVPANAARNYAPDGLEVSFAHAASEVRALMRIYEHGGYGLGHRVGLLLDNRPEHLWHKIALNALGACCVPINPDYRANELAYVIDHARLDLVVVTGERVAQLDAAREVARHRTAAVTFDRLSGTLPHAPSKRESTFPDAQDPAVILYTSGTTGRPKGCVLSHRYELAAGAWYARRGGLATVRETEDRLYNPLPLFHVNAGILSFWCMLLTGNCQVQTDRFQPSRWWTEVRDSRATIVHYLGVVIPLLLKQPAGPQDRDHRVRFGFGAGVEPQLHAPFEERFGFPLLELWGMTEVVRALVDCDQPRQVGTRAFGRAKPGLDARVAGDDGTTLPDGTPGELLVRYSEATPRKDFFSGYLDDPAATEAAWEGGWFHTGDIVVRDETGMLHFVDRRKNIIRRAGENIAAAEVEALLLTHPRVRQVAVMAVPDEIREEEVLACVALDDGDAPPDDLARELFAYCNERLAYYKAPGWLWIADVIPTTATQKIQKHTIFPAGVDPRTVAGMIDLRALKKRN